MKLILLVSMFSFGAHAGNFELYLKGTSLEEDRLLDKATGKIWKRTCVAMIKYESSAVCSAFKWTPEAVDGVNTIKEVQEYMKGEKAVADSVNSRD